MDRPVPRTIVISCEHGGNRIPKQYAALFTEAADLLDTHRGYDIGAAPLSRQLSNALDAPLFLHRYSRLLADANRRADSRTVFSAFTRKLGREEKRRILATFHEPYRRAVATKVREAIAEGKAVLHLSVHSFTPVLKGKVRTADIGFLYDPKRNEEKRVSGSLIEAFAATGWNLRCRRNYPYRGVSDSLTTVLRKKFPENRYAGIEIEVNQRFALATPQSWRSFQAFFTRTVAGDLVRQGSP